MAQRTVDYVTVGPNSMGSLSIPTKNPVQIVGETLEWMLCRKVLSIFANNH